MPTLGEICASAIFAERDRLATEGKRLTPLAVAFLIDLEDTKRMNVPTVAPKGAEPTPEAIYEAYPRKVGRKVALTAIQRAIKAITDDPALVVAIYGSPRAYLLACVQSYAKATETWPHADRAFIPHPATWFNQGRYADDPREWASKSGDVSTKPKAAEDYRKF